MENLKPSQKDIQKAEEMMSPEQAEASKTRESLYIQKRSKFLDEVILDQDKGDQRRTPTPEERDSMDSNFQQLGKIFEGSDIRWQLDGALNISLMKGDYIGVHKDVDVSVEASDLEKLDDKLGGKEYGLFLTTEDPDDRSKRLMRRVGAQQFEELRRAKEAPLQIIAIDDSGKIDSAKSLSFIDCHLIKRSDNGNPLGHGGINLPNKWGDPQPTVYQGQEINMSHPAKVAFYKIHGSRPFDVTDTKILAETGKLKPKDVDEIEETFKQEFEVRRKEANLALEKIVAKITPESTAEDIYNAFVSEPLIAEKLKQDQSIKEPLTMLASKISETDKSPEQIKKLTLEMFNIEKSFDEQKKKISDLRKWVTETARLKEVRGSLGLDK